MSEAITYQIRTASAQDTAACRPDQPMLDSLLRSNIWVPNSCNQGTCGTCKVQILLGEVDHARSPLDTLTAEERLSGLALACQAVPCSDVEIQPLGGCDDDVHRHRLRDFEGTVTVLEDIADDTRRLVVSLAEPLEFSAGQYVEIAVPDSPHRRQYSMANPPEQANALEFHIRRVPSGEATDRWIFGGLRTGDRIQITGPYGDFTYATDDLDSPMILVGGGTGLAPLKSIMVHALGINPEREIHLYHGARGSGDLYDAELFREYASSFANVSYIPALSDEDWEGRTGHVTEVLLEDFDSCKGYSGYLCGPPVMVEAGVKALKRRRMAPRKIHREKFSVAAPATELVATQG